MRPAVGGSAGDGKINFAGGVPNMLKVLFLILIAMSSVTFAQAQQTDKPYKFFEYEKISKGLLKEKIESLCIEIDKTSWVGWIINYGTPKQLAGREKQIKETNLCRQEFPSPRIIFVRVEDENKSKTEFWLVPPGEKPPIPQN
jgi:hypothetical protein